MDPRRGRPERPYPPPRSRAAAVNAERLGKILMVVAPFVLAFLAWLVVRWVQGL